MTTQFRDTKFGHLARFLSRNKLFQYPDEIDPSLWKMPLQQNKASAITGVVEDGKDIYLVDWYGPDDPENPQNWPRSWKLLVTFQICLFNFSVYIASSIYVPGEPSIIEDFGVSETVATLGLSLFTV
ncbi:hypothetical protein G7Y89_g14345 [Cudoniella acicularis]|uniref:Uncharacterized protein n=1 Tax=Cudoniella acicularis TaxID=354080 RepID=A0A8H4R3B4_9HELO|nr:hypothetical protein G7Y89_g14345 [Cudoniella acicularis]